MESKGLIGHKEGIKLCFVFSWLYLHLSFCAPWGQDFTHRGCLYQQISPYSYSSFLLGLKGNCSFTLTNHRLFYFLSWFLRLSKFFVNSPWIKLSLNHLNIVCKFFPHWYPEDSTIESNLTLPDTEAELTTFKCISMEL